MKPRAFEISERLKSNLDMFKRLHGDRWPELMADVGTALQLQMKATGETNPIAAAIPVAKAMSRDHQNPMLLLAVATELANAPGVIHSTDWLYVGKKVGHRDTRDRWRRHGEVIDVLPFGEFIVKWDEIKQPERMLRYDLRDVNQRTKNAFAAMEMEQREDYAEYVKRCGGVPISKVKP